MRKFNDPVTRPALYAISSKTPHGNTEKIYTLIDTPAAATGPHKRKAAHKTSSYPAEGPRSREAACLDAIAETCKHNRHATVKDIANQLGITTILLCRLEEKHLINYQRYKGASLTPEGTAVTAENLALRTSLCDLLIMAGVPADSDDTAACIMALIAGGISPDDPVIKKAVQFLRDVQEPTGGFNYGYYSESNLASTVWVIQALCAADVDPATFTNNGKSPIDYILSLQQEDGSFKYTEYVVDSPVGMTGRAIPALMGKPYPVLPGQKAYNIRSTAYSGITPAAGSSSAAPADTPVPVAAQTSAQWTPATLTDDYGYQITIDKEPQRIVSLAPANTEMIFALGLGDRVVGVTEYCNYPEEATTKPVIGGYTTVNIERVVAQKPDLVIAYYGNGEETVSHLRQLGLTVMTMNSDSVAGTFHDIELIGKATGKTTEAEQLTKNMQKRIDAVTAKLQGITTTPTAFHCVWADPLWVSGGQTFQDEIITLAGGQNPFNDVNGWGIITMERLLTTNPDYIIVDSGMGMGEGGHDILKDYFLTEPRLQELTAVKNNHVYVMNADIIDRGGPRIVDCLEQLAKILHPDAFGTENQTAAATRAPGFGTILTLTAAACALCLIRKH